MKIRLLLSTLLLAVSLGILAQRAQNRANRTDAIKTERITFIIQRVGLTPAEIAIFVPIYDEYKQKSWELGRARVAALRATPTNDAEFEQAIEDYINHKQRDADLAREYNTKFRAVLSPEKLFKLYVAEWEFQRQAVAPQR